MQISPIQQTQYQTANPSFQRLRGVKFVENTVYIESQGKNYVFKANKFFDKKKLTKLIKADFQLKEFFKKFDGWVVFSEEPGDLGYRLNDKCRSTLSYRRDGIMTIRYEDPSLKGAFLRKIKNLFKPVAKKDLLEMNFLTRDYIRCELGDNRQNSTDWYSELIKERNGAKCILNPLWDRHEINVENHYYNIEQLKKLRAMREVDEKNRIEEERLKQIEFENYCFWEMEKAKGNHVPLGWPD